MQLFYYYLLYLEPVFLSVAYLTVANLARLGISVHCQVSVRSQCLVRLLSQCWITGGHTIHPPIEGLLPPTGIEPTPFRNSASKVAGLQVHATTLVVTLLTLFKKRLQRRCISMTFAKMLRIPLLKNTAFKEHLQTTAPNFRIEFEFSDVNNWLFDSPNVHSQVHHFRSNISKRLRTKFCFLRSVKSIFSVALFPGVG